MNLNINDPHRLLLNLSHKMNLRKSDKYVALSNLSMYYTQKNVKKSCNCSKCMMSAPTCIEKFELPNINHILYQIFKIILSIS